MSGLHMEEPAQSDLTCH